MDLTARTAALAHWASIVVAPVLYLTNLSIVYALVPLACDTQHEVSLHLANGSTLVLMIAALALAWHVYRASAPAGPTAADAVDRDRFLSTIGLCISALLVLVVIVQWSAQWFLSPCYS
jgi:hypothetical protein